MPTRETKPELTARQAAFVAAVTAAAKNAGRRVVLLRAHPDAADLSLVSHMKPPALDGLLWSELERAEAKLLPPAETLGAAPSRSAVTYYQRRRALAPLRQWRRVSRGLPPLWRTLVDLPAHQVKSCCSGLGLAFAVVAMRGQPREAVRVAVAPLGADLGQRVVEHLATAAGEQGETVVGPPLREALTRLGVQLHGRELCVALAQAALAGLFLRLPPAARAAAAGAARSNLMSLLDATRPIVLGDDAGVARLNEVVEGALRGLQPNEVGA